MLGRERGDTIIEVLLAITVFSVIAVGALTLMNRGTQTAQKTLEVTLVRQQIDAQAETLRYIYGKSIDNPQSDSSERAAWIKMVTQSSNGGYAVPPDSTAVKPLSKTQSDGSCQPVPSHAFILDAHQGTLPPDQARVLSNSEDDAAPYPHAYYDEEGLQGATGLWIESVKAQTSGYVDFYIKACWYAPGEGPATTMGTIVRLYAPTN